MLDHKHMLGEMQLAFVCLLMAQNFSGFNQWKQFVHLFCSCQELVRKQPSMFIDFIGESAKYLSGVLVEVLTIMQTFCRSSLMNVQMISSEISCWKATLWLLCSRYASEYALLCQALCILTFSFRTWAKTLLVWIQH